MTRRTLTRVSMAACTVSTGLAARAFASTGGEVDSGLVVWGFIGFCAVILVGQLLPAFVGFLSARKVMERRLREELGRELETERAHSVFDRK